jgi:hypothetical protein
MVNNHQYGAYRQNFFFLLFPPLFRTWPFGLTMGRGPPELVEFLEFPHRKALSPLTHFLVLLAAFFCRHVELGLSS